MRIGVDFDNTIACYDGVFTAAALERGLIPPDLPRDKNSVRDYLNNSGRKDEFTQLQGYVYGARMDLVACYPGVRDFISMARARSHDVFIVSHKTQHPILGPRYDLHVAARGFLEAQNLIGDEGVPSENVYFELTKEEKVARAAALDVDVFIDDLPEILAMSGWPSRTRAILFDPEGRFTDTTWNGRRFERRGSWEEISLAVVEG